jgi:hypothetical protein
MKRDDAHQPGKRRAGSRGRERGQQTAGPSVFGSPGWTFCTRVGLTQEEILLL